MLVDLERAAEGARWLLAWADGYEEASANTPVAARCRMLARDLLDLIDGYRDERQGREAMQHNYQRCLEVMQSRLYRDAVAARANGNGDNPFPVLR